MKDVFSQWEALAKELIEERGDLRTRTSVTAYACLSLIDLIRKKDVALQAASAYVHSVSCDNDVAVQCQDICQKICHALSLTDQLGRGEGK